MNWGTGACKVHGPEEVGSHPGCRGLPHLLEESRAAGCCRGTQPCGVGEGGRGGCVPGTLRCLRSGSPTSPWKRLQSGSALLLGGEGREARGGESDEPVPSERPMWLEREGVDGSHQGWLLICTGLLFGGTRVAVS